MSEPVIVPVELNRACEILITRAGLLRQTTRKVTREEWSIVSLPSGSHIPAWIIELHTRFALADIVLNTTHWTRMHLITFSFHTPQTIAGMDQRIFATLIKSGYFPLAYDNLGNLWTCRNDGDASGVIDWFIASEWDGHIESLAKHREFASSRLSLLLSSMGILPTGNFAST